MGGVVWQAAAVLRWISRGAGLQADRGPAAAILTTAHITALYCTVDSYLQGPKQVKDRKYGKKKVAWPLSK